MKKTLSEQEMLSTIKGYICENDYVPTKKELIKEGILTQGDIAKHGGYLALLEKIGYSYPGEYTKNQVLNKLNDYISALDYVPYQREIYENGILSQYTLKKHGGYENLLRELGYEYPKWRAEDWTKEEMKQAFLDIYTGKSPSIEQVYEDYKLGKLPFNMFVIRRKFGTLNAFAKYCGLELNAYSVHYYTKGEIKELFLERYDITDIPPQQLEVDEDYRSGDFKFSADMLGNKFGSYNKFLKYCGFEVFNSRFSYPCIAKDGHLCDSRAEKFIDDFMYINNIKHKPHPRYSSFIEGFKKTNKADWALEDGTIVEYFGLMGYEKYEEKMKEKIKLLEDNNIQYIAIYPNNLNNLGNVFDEHLERRVV